MNGKIINFNDELQKRLSLKKQIKQLTVDDIFNLLLIYKHNEGILTSFNLDFAERVFGRYKHMERFSIIFSNIGTEYNKNGEEIINFSKIIEQKQKEKAVILISGDVVILGDDEYFNSLKRKYNEEIFSIFDSLILFINDDLQFGFDNWELLFEDEYIKDKVYPGIVTGEFIGQTKDAKIMKQVRKKAIERLRNNYKQ